MKLPAFTCAPGCSACCKVSLALCTHADRKRIAALRPDLEWTAWGADGWVLTKHLEMMRCPLLGADDRCSVYDARPKVCQLYGLVDAPGMVCKRGGKADRMLTDKEARRFQRQPHAAR